MEDFSTRVFDWVKKIPAGAVSTYGEIAALAGSPGAARVVGNLMKQNRDPSVPCHRVICSDGKLDGYNGNLGKKEELLKGEGVKIFGRKVIQK